MITKINIEAGKRYQTFRGNNEPDLTLPLLFGKSVIRYGNKKLTNMEILRGLIWCVENNIKLNTMAWKKYKEYKESL